MAISLPFWEFDELVNHLTLRKDIWTQDEDVPELWVRFSDREQTNPVMALQLVPAEGESPWRQGQVMITPLEWDLEQATDYVDRLLRSKTGLGIRLEMEQVLISEMSLDVDQAHNLGLILAHINNVGPVLETRITIPKEVFQEVGRPGHFFGQWQAMDEKGMVSVRMHNMGNGLLKALVGISRFTAGGAAFVDLQGFLHPIGTDVPDMHVRMFDEEAQSA